MAIPESVGGQLDLEHLEAQLKVGTLLRVTPPVSLPSAPPWACPLTPSQERRGCGRLMIGAFSAASNLTGVLTDPDPVTSLLHRYGALAFWDYATAGRAVCVQC